MSDPECCFALASLSADERAVLLALLGDQDEALARQLEDDQAWLSLDDTSRLIDLLDPAAWSSEDEVVEELLLRLGAAIAGCEDDEPEDDEPLPWASLISGSEVSEEADRALSPAGSVRRQQLGSARSQLEFSLTASVAQRFSAYAQAAWPREIGGLLRIVSDDDGRFEAVDLKVFPHLDANRTYFELDGEAVARFNLELVRSGRRDELSQWRGLIHSHPNMRPFCSGEDEENLQRLAGRDGIAFSVILGTGGHPSSNEWAAHYAQGLPVKLMTFDHPVDCPSQKALYGIGLDETSAQAIIDEVRELGFPARSQEAWQHSPPPQTAAPSWVSPLFAHKYQRPTGGDGVEVTELLTASAIAELRDLAQPASQLPKHFDHQRLRRTFALLADQEQPQLDWAGVGQVALTALVLQVTALDDLLDHLRDGTEESALPPLAADAILISVDDLGRGRQPALMAILHAYRRYAFSDFGIALEQLAADLATRRGLDRPRAQLLTDISSDRWQTLSSIQRGPRQAERQLLGQLLGQLAALDLNPSPLPPAPARHLTRRGVRISQLREPSFSVAARLSSDQAQALFELLDHHSSVPAETLATLLRRGPLSRTEVAAIVAGADSEASGLARRGCDLLANWLELHPPALDRGPSPASKLETEISLSPQEREALLETIDCLGADHERPLELERLQQKLCQSTLIASSEAQQLVELLLRQRSLLRARDDRAGLENNRLLVSKLVATAPHP